MKRHIFKNLQDWKRGNTRKPLILKGARQVGKTYILQAFGRQEYTNVAYFNFENSPHLHELFSGSLKSADIIKILSIELSAEIKPETTLIIFDEIQECPAALNSLKYFNETANEYHICAAGSLLGVMLVHGKGFPVGKVDFLTLYPLSFEEFLEAKEDKMLIEYIPIAPQTANFNIPSARDLSTIAVLKIRYIERLYASFLRLQSLKSHVQLGVKN